MFQSRLFISRVYNISNSLSEIDFILFIYLFIYICINFIYMYT